MAHACNPHIHKAKAGGCAEFEAILGCRMRFCLKIEKKKKLERNETPIYVKIQNVKSKGNL